MTEAIDEPRPRFTDTVVVIEELTWSVEHLTRSVACLHAAVREMSEGVVRTERPPNPHRQPLSLRAAWSEYGPAVLLGLACTVAAAALVLYLFWGSIA